MCTIWPKGYERPNSAISHDGKYIFRAGVDDKTNVLYVAIPERFYIGGKSVEGRQIADSVREDVNKVERYMPWAVDVDVETGVQQLSQPRF